MQTVPLIAYLMNKHNSKYSNVQSDVKSYVNEPRSLNKKKSLIICLERDRICLTYILLKLHTLFG